MSAILFAKKPSLLTRLTKAVKALFANGEQGLWLDPSDLSTLYQDSAGTTAVTATGQPDGLMLDKRLGLVLGPELVANGGFDSDTVWTKGAGVTISGGTANYLNVSALDPLYQGVLVVGKYYEITFTVLNYSAGAVQVYNANVAIGTAKSANGTYTVWGLARDNNNLIFKVVGTTTLSIDNISCKEITGNHVSQATAAARPVYTAASGIKYLAFDGVDDGLATATFAAGTLTSNMDCFIAIKRNSTATAATVYSDSTHYLGGFAVGGAGTAALGSGTPTHLANGVAVPGGTATTQGQLDTAVPVGSWYIHEIRNADLSAWTKFALANLATLRINGSIGGIVLCPAQTDAKRTQIRQYLANKVGVVL